MLYTETKLWKASFSIQGDSNDKLREELKSVFEKTRKNAEFLLSKIRKDFENLTVHDISHVDGLWQVASVITGDGYEINPLEGFVLGCSFLMHDAVLSYDAIGGVDRLRDTSEWKDYFEDYKKNEHLTEQQQLFETDFKTIRLLHAREAETLYSKLFEREDKSTFYIIEDETLRNHLGPLICKIAASHHWNIDQVETLGNQQSAPSEFPVEWRINPIKLACILRCADAGHIDAGRAPDYLLKLLTINGVSRQHWIAQNRLSQIDVDIDDKEKVRICSNIDFSEEDFASWNVACDAVNVLNHELLASNELLKRSSTPQFQIKGVRGVESRQTLSKYIKTNGWMPCDANIHISNVEGLIHSLGGENLYGKERKIEIVLRELIQNARDAIVARRQREKEGFDGHVNVKISNDINGKTWIEVTDDGVGMSMQTIKDYFLNFGSSFWSSDLAKSEYPGLNASGFVSSGRFGIGFYSVFMIAEEVIIDSRKYDQGLEENNRIRFPNGLCLRPIVKRTRGESTRISTSIRIKIDNSKANWSNTMKMRSGVQGVPDFDVPYTSVLSNLTAALDVDVFYSELGASPIKIHTNLDSQSFDGVKWLKDITYSEYRGRNQYVEYIDKNYHRIRKVEHDGKVYGLAFLNTMYDDRSSFYDVTTVGRLSNFGHQSGAAEYVGCLFAEPATARRDGLLPDAVKIEWAKEQYQLLLAEGLSNADKIFLPYILGKYGIDLTDVMHIRCVSKKWSNEWRIYDCNLKSLIKQLKENSLQLVLPLSSLSDKNYNRIEYYIDYERSCQRLNDNELLFRAERISDFLNVNENDDKFYYNIFQCLKIITEGFGYKMNCVTANNKIISILEGPNKAMIISVE